MAVCGKGGVGKTVFSALFSRVLIEQGLTPLLLVDADPVGGLTSAIGEKAVNTLAGVRDRFIGEARKGNKANLAQVEWERRCFQLFFPAYSLSKA